MQHKEVEEEAFVAPDTQGDADSPYIDPETLSGYQSKSKKRSAPRSKHRVDEPKRVHETEPGDIVEVEGALFEIVRKGHYDRWARTHLPLTNQPCYQTGPYHLDGELEVTKMIRKRPISWGGIP